jgi:primosomal protein N'
MTTYSIALTYPKPKTLKCQVCGTKLLKDGSCEECRNRKLLDYYYNMVAEKRKKGD